MSMIGSSWKDDPTPEEQHKEITGREFCGSKRELEKEIQKGIDSGYSSKTERSRLRDLQVDINQQNK